MNSKILGLLTGAIVSVTAFAGELQRVTVQASKETPQLVVIKSGKDVVAEVKVIKSGSLTLEAKNISWAQQPGNGPRIYNCSGTAKVELLVEGKCLLQASSESLYVQSLPADSGKK